MDKTRTTATVSKSWQVGLIKISEWEKDGASGKYYQYSLNKTEYTKPSGADTKGTYTNLFSLGFGRKEDVIIVKFLLENRRKEGMKLGDYELQFDEKSKYFTLIKHYTDKDGVDQVMQAPMNTVDILSLLSLLDIFIQESLVRKYVRKGNFYQSSSAEDDNLFISEIEDVMGNSSSKIDDDLPF